MNLEELTKHTKLGIDFDGTLIEHDRSHILQRFVLENRRDKQFYIITFRTHDLLDRIEDDLREAALLTGVPLRMGHFTGLHSVPRHLYLNWHRTLAVPYGSIIRADSPEAEAYFGWKAEICQEIGCTVLLDDMEPFISKHCTPRGVLCLNPDHF